MAGIREGGISKASGPQHVTPEQALERHPWRKSDITPAERAKGRTEEKDNDPDIVWVGENYQVTDDATAGRVLRFRIKRERQLQEAEQERREGAALDKLVKEEAARMAESEAPEAPEAPEVPAEPKILGSPEAPATKAKAKKPKGNPFARRTTPARALNSVEVEEAEDAQ